MNFNKHSELEGQHAFLSPSRYHWINYNEEKLDTTFKKYLSTQYGIRLHSFACEAIQLGIKLPKSRKTLHLYVNDAIGYKMTTEQLLYYSSNCFGTADAISFRQNTLRIHDLKTGESPTSMRQLEVYTALFCLEYEVDPKDIKIELRIYQLDEVLVHEPLLEDIYRIMEKIVLFDKQIDKTILGEV
jgi:hypothetical protein